MATLAVASDAAARDANYRRLPQEMLQVTPPSERARGVVGAMRVRALACRTMPISEMRQRIVNIAVQEWGFFGFPIVDYTDLNDDNRFDPSEWRFRFPSLPQEETVRVAASVAGYWAVTSQGAAMVARQNQAWSEPWGINGRWADPWSAAFISWVICEAGLSDNAQFQRAIAHWSYIDQAIRARDGSAPNAAFIAYDLGDEPIVPGDLLCSSRRPVYRNVTERRRHLGVGARSHCDIVVKVDEARQRIYTIGGNVRRSVSLKMFPAMRTAGKNLRPRPITSDIDDERPMFAHLKLRAGAIEANALDNSPTIKALDCDLIFAERHPAYGVIPVNVPKNGC